MTKFSVLMAVYKNDKPEDVRVAVESVTIRQTLQPDELLIVVDGKVPEALEKVLLSLQIEISSIHIEWCQENRGLGLALQYGMKKVSHELVARMDSDDISLPTRFEKQIAMFEADPDLSVAGGYIDEFIDSVENIVGRRVVPVKHEELCNYLKHRDGFNHMTVMFRRSAVMKAGNYQHWYLNEDSYLWARMYLVGCKFGNLNETLVLVRVGRDMYARRGGWKLFKGEWELQVFKLKNKIVNPVQFAINVGIRFFVQVLMNNGLRTLVFQKLLRQRS